MTVKNSHMDHILKPYALPQVESEYALFDKLKPLLVTNACIVHDINTPDISIISGNAITELHSTSGITLTPSGGR